MLRILLFCLGGLFLQDVWGQSTIPALNQQAIEIAKRLNLRQHGEHFYTQTQPVTGCYYYVYASHTDSVKNALPGKFLYPETNKARAEQLADSLRKQSLDVMLFEAPANMGSQITTCMLTHTLTENAFLMVHEAAHFDILNFRPQIRPHEEEAYCDLIANYYAKNLPGVVNRDYRKQRRKQERIYRIINRCLESKISNATAQHKITKQLRETSAFYKQRYGNPVNNAYLVRYQAFCQSYFILRKRAGIHWWCVPDLNTLKARIGSKKPGVLPANSG